MLVGAFSVIITQFNSISNFAAVVARLSSDRGTHMSDGQILRALRDLDLEPVLQRAGGLDAALDGNALALTEQQLLACAKVLLASPRFVFLDRVQTTLNSEQLRRILRLFSESSITCVSNGELGDAPDLQDAVLALGEDGHWTWTPTRA